MSVTWPLIDVENPPLGIVSDNVVSAIEQARRDLLLAYSEGVPLSVLGQNAGISRPPQLPDDDVMFRKIIRLLSWQPKTINFTVYALLSAILGSQSEIIADSKRPWRVYEVNANEIIIELPLVLIGTSNTNASYLHGAYGYGSVVAGGPFNTFTTPGDLSEASATTLVGKNLRFNTAVGVWTDYTVNSSTYSAITGLSTVVVSAATLPAGGGYFYVEIPGDLTSSYRGDYLAPGNLVLTFNSAAGPPTSTLTLTGDATQHLDVSTAVSVYNGTTVVATTIATVSAYAPSTNTTTVTIATTVAGGLVNALFLHELEQADTATTPPHDDRVYLTGLGLFEIFQYYFDLLVRAAGIVVRVELI